MRQGKVLYKGSLAGILTETDDGEYVFQYDEAYIEQHPQDFLSFTMPVTGEPYVDNRLFPFFEGLIPEGWLLDIASKSWKINQNDRMGLLLACCRNCIGAVSVEPGSKLVIDGGKITNHCDGWSGIYVAGNPNQPQYSSSQGKIELLNGATLSNARDAITNEGVNLLTGHLDGRVGGIIYANNSNFINNRRDVQLLKYYNSGGPHGGDYMAEFYNCNFRRNDNFSIQEMLASITMWDVQGVKIKNCDFQNSHTGSLRYDGGAIYTINASYRVTELPNNPGSGCTFSGYREAIKSENSICTQKNIIIENAVFTDNIHSIYHESVQGARIVYNDITVQNQTVPPMPSFFQPARYGIYMDESTNYQIHGNVLKTEGSNGSNISVGMVFKNNGIAPNQPYDNEIDGFTFGIESIGRNRDGSNSYNGIEFKCNELGSSNTLGSSSNPTSFGNLTDILVSPHASGSLANQGVSLMQGDFPPAGTQQHLANNLFSSQSTAKHFINTTSNTVNYFSGAGNSRLTPTNNTAINVVTKPNVPVNLTQACGGRYKNANAIPSDFTNRITLAETELANRLTQRDQLINGGSNSTIESQILFADDQQDYQNLYIDVMDASPYVEPQLLLDIIAIADFPELALRNIMIANPHAAREGEVSEALLNRIPALSQQTLDDIESGEQTITAFDVVNMQIDIAQFESEYATIELLDYYSSTGTDNQQAIRNHLKSRDESYFRYMLVESYLAEKLAQNAQNEIDAIELECDLSEEEHSELQLMKSYYTIIGDNIDDLKNLGSSEISQLTNLASNDEGYLVSGKARNLLTLNNVEIGYVEPIIIHYGTTSNKKENMQTAVARPTLPSINVQISPNPATEYVLLEWNRDEFYPAENIRINIISLNGNLLRFFESIDVNLERQLVQIKDLAKGTYFLEIADKENTLYQEKFVIN